MWIKGLYMANYYDSAYIYIYLIYMYIYILLYALFQMFQFMFEMDIFVHIGYIVFGGRGPIILSSIPECRLYWNFL